LQSDASANSQRRSRHHRAYRGTRLRNAYTFFSGCRAGPATLRGVVPPEIVRALQEAHPLGVPIDTLGAACTHLSNAQIEEVVAGLEARSVPILHEPTASGAEVLKKLLPAARALREELGRKPTVMELATRSGLSESATMHGLLYVRVLSR
jgi:hypothetical protein